MGKGRGGLSGYRLVASLDLKQSRGLAATISWGRLFHSGMVRGKNDVCLYCVLLSVTVSLSYHYFRSAVVSDVITNLSICNILMMARSDFRGK